MVNVKGRSSKSDYKLIKILEPLSHIKLIPFTGRTHQLRVHMQSIGHPIFGDSVYGGGRNKIKSYHKNYSSKLNKIFKLLNRVALHARIIEIIHPRTGKKMKFEAETPKDIRRAVNLLNNE